MVVNKETLKQIIKDNNFGLVSADSDNRSKYENLKKYRDLMRLLDYARLPYIQVRGVWDGGGENSILMPHCTAQTLIRLGNRFSQDVVIHGHDLIVCGSGFYANKIKRYELTEDKPDGDHTMIDCSDGIMYLKGSIV